MTSGNELINLAPNTNIFMYHQLHNLSNWKQLFPVHNQTFILYEWKPENGHWCALVTGPYGLEFFDPYGYMIDHWIGELPPQMGRQLHEDHQHLLRLINQYPGDIWFNHFKFQRESPRIKTCGKHCLIRILNNHICMYKYKDHLDTIMRVRNLNDYDEVINYLWNLLKKRVENPSY